MAIRHVHIHISGFWFRLESQLYIKVIYIIQYIYSMRPELNFTSYPFGGKGDRLRDIPSTT